MTTTLIGWLIFYALSCVVAVVIGTMSGEAAAWDDWPDLVRASQRKGIA